MRKVICILVLLVVGFVSFAKETVWLNNQQYYRYNTWTEYWDDMYSIGECDIENNKAQMQYSVHSIPCNYAKENTCILVYAEKGRILHPDLQYRLITITFWYDDESDSNIVTTLIY